MMALHLIVAAGLLACESAAIPLIAAHRGGMESGQPENTLPALRHAAGIGADVVELDVRTTRDGHLVVLHDPTVDRTTNGRGALHELDLAAVRLLSTGEDARIPTLEEALDASRRIGVGLLLDLKTGPGLDHARLARTVAERQDPDSVLFGVRSLTDHRQLRAELPNGRFLGFVPNPGAIDGFLDAGIEAIRVWPGWLDRDPDLVARIQAAGARVWVTAGDAADEDLLTLAGLGVDAVLTDRPAAARIAFGCAD